MKITLNPIKEIIPNFVVKTTVENLTHELALSQSSLSWCNGIVLCLDEYSDRDLQSQKEGSTKFDGVYNLEGIYYAECKEKTNVLKFNGWAVDVVDRTGHELFEELTKQLLEREKC